MCPFFRILHDQPQHEIEKKAYGTSKCQKSGTAEVQESTILAIQINSNCLFRRVPAPQLESRSWATKHFFLFTQKPASCTQKNQSFSSDSSRSPLRDPARLARSSRSALQAHAIFVSLVQCRRISRRRRKTPAA